MKNCSLILALIFHFFFAHSEEEDPKRLSLFMIDSSWNAMLTDQQAAIRYGKWAFDFAKKAMSDELMAKSLRRISMSFNYANQLDSAHYYIDKAIEIEKNRNSPFHLAICFLNKGEIFYDQANWKSALTQFNKAIPSFEAVDSLDNVARTYNSIAKVHEKVGDTALARQSYYTALKIRKSLEKPNAIAKSLEDISIFHLQNGETEKAFTAIRKALSIQQKLGTKNLISRLYSTIGGFHHYSNPDSALFYYRKALSFNNSLISVRLTSNVAAMMIELHQPDSALKILMPLLQHKEVIANGELKEKVLNNISYAYEEKKDYQLALDYYYESIKIRDSVNSIEIKKSIREIQEKYDNERIRAVNAKLELKQKRLMIIITITAALCVIAILLVILYRQKMLSKAQLALKNEQISQQKIAELIKEKEVDRMANLMEGQEQERSRIAAELHDSIGSLLSTVKLHFEAIGSKLDVQVEQYNKGQEILDQACVEVRRISHNLASNVLAKFGFTAALYDMADTISTSGKLKMEVYVKNIDGALKNKQEIQLFRIIQELINNAIKHAKANVISITITRDDNELNAMIEDDGVGYDVATVEQKDGMGLANLKARVNHLNGKYHVESSLGNGTIVIVDIPL
ncbi:MAG: sensor histidine kinase [Bacteroidetes bacterium]|nr:sensor histidine kinase [Bacteroidota bacterium]